jgi:hypothetical protein
VKTGTGIEGIGSIDASEPLEMVDYVVTQATVSDGKDAHTTYETIDWGWFDNNWQSVR